jgi:TusA-related sulfurtransferase
MRAKAEATGRGKTNAPTTETSVGHEFLTQLARRDFEAIAACFMPGVCFRALTPHGLREASGATEAVERLQSWFDAADSFVLSAEDVRAVANRLHLAYRIELREQGREYLVVQQAYCDTSEGRIAAMDLLCSGFLPVHGGEHREQASPEAASVPRTDAELDASGESCATLTPLIQATMRTLQSGQVLAVRVDEPEAREGIPAWSRLTGNALLAAVDDGDGRMQFYLRRK